MGTSRCKRSAGGDERAHQTLRLGGRSHFAAYLRLAQDGEQPPQLRPGGNASDLAYRLARQETRRIENLRSSALRELRQRPGILDRRRAAHPEVGESRGPELRPEAMEKQAPIGFGLRRRG